MSEEEQPPQMPDLMQPAVVLGMAYLSRNYVDDKNPQHVLYVRMLFASSICVMVILNLYIYLLINGKKDKDEDEKEIKVNNPQTGKEEIYKTNKAYDMSEMKKKLTQLIMGVCIVSFIHYKWAIIAPLCVQSVLQPMTLFKSPLAKIYLFGKDDVKRPFDSGAGNNPFAKMLKGFQDQQKDEKKKKRYEKIKKKTGAELRKEKRER